MVSDYTRAISGAPVACTLASAERGERQGFLEQRLSENVEEVRELHDGYALRYAAEPPIVAGLLEVILAERECCPFFTFELVFEPDQGPLWLRLRGPEGTKEVIRAMLGGSVAYRREAIFCYPNSGGETLRRSGG